MSDEFVTDATGVPIHPGDRIAVAEHRGNVAIIRIGVVEEVHDASGKVTIKWTDAQARFKSHSTLSANGERVKRPRMVVIN